MVMMMYSKLYYSVIHIYFSKLVILVSQFDPIPASLDCTVFRPDKILKLSNVQIQLYI
jgi:hypothetical protein